MSKQDDYRFSAELKAMFPGRGISSDMKAAMSKAVDSNKRACISLKMEGKKLVIAVKAKDINMLRATMNTITETIKMLERVDKI